MTFSRMPKAPRKSSSVAAFLLLLGAVLSTAAASTVVWGESSSEQHAVQQFEAARGNPLLLYAFLRAMPKGGDLHNHPSGSEYAEQYIAFAAEDGLCVRRDTMTLVPPPCDASAGRPPVSDALRQQTLYGELVDAWSVRGISSGSDISGHDQFFGSFDRFGLASSRRTADVIADIMSRAAGENVRYLELMFGLDRGAASDLGGKVGWDPDPGVTYGRLQTNGLDAVVAQSRKALDATEARIRERLGCDTPRADPGCQITVRYIQTGTRVAPPERVFAQLAAGFKLAAADSRVVGVNLVAPEDAYVARRDYHLHMSMLDYLHGRAPGVPIALHAGELAPGLVPPEDLRFHIREAVEMGHALRIGHGVDVFYEDDPFGLLAEMSERRVLVEIALTSNDQILGVRGPSHPFPLYRRFGVPVALVTDDMGVSRSTMTAQYQQAVETHGLGYSDVKRLARTSLEYAFLPGESLWRDLDEAAPVYVCASDLAASSAEPSGQCSSWLEGTERGRAQWRLEREFATFEQRL